MTLAAPGLVALALLAPGAAAPAPLACPVSSAQAELGEHPLALGDGRFVRLSKTALVDFATDGRVVARTPIPARDEIQRAALACAADGRFAVGWIEEDRRGDYRARLALRSADGRFERAIALGRVRESGDFDVPISDIALAYAPDGELLVAWTEIGRVRAVTFSASGKRGVVVTLGRASDIGELVTEIAGNGRAVVAWTSHDTGLQVDNSNRVRAAFRTHHRLFGPAQLVHVGNAVDPDDGQPLDLRLAVAPDGRALLMWSDITGRRHFNYPVRVASAAPHGHFRRSIRLTRDGAVGDVALGNDGTALAAWREPRVLRVTSHPPRRPFGPAQTVTAPWTRGRLSLSPDLRPTVR